MPTVALYTGPFDPPVRHHRRVAELLSQRYETVLIVPGGPRAGSCKTPFSPTIHRATMSDLNFRGLDNTTIDLDDLEYDRFTPHHEIESRMQAQGKKVSFVVSTELIRDGGSGESFIHREWQHGERLWAESHFTILHEAGEPIDRADCPRNVELIQIDPHLRSESVRSMLTHDEVTEGYLYPPVEAYIRRQGLYRDVTMARRPPFRLNGPRLGLFVDERNAEARALAKTLQPYVSDDPEVIVSLGGDGTMLRAIRSHWRDRLPFFGINAGGQGFLLNGRTPNYFWTHDLLLYHLPLLHVETEFRDGRTVQSLAFNDAWVERSTGQTAWLRVHVNGVERVPKLVGDGLLVATAAGSSSYARAMGATPVPMNTDVLILAGSNVYLPTFWRPALLPTDSIIEIETLDANRRPLRAAIDGYEETDPVRKMTVRVSRTAAAEIAFLPEHDPVAKLAFMQFPSS
ncbi:MAG: NAD(+)/NADH kinase [Gemmataceae bacterium]